MNLVLRPLREGDEAAFLAGAKLWQGEDPHWYSFHWQKGMSFSELLERERSDSQGVNLPPGRVPATMYYAFLGEQIVGRLHVRHELNDSLKKRGGHLGYAVAPAFRGRGIGREIIRKAPAILKGLGISRALITCADANEPSWRMIERAGGILSEKTWDEVDEELIRRYWLDVL